MQSENLWAELPRIGIIRTPLAVLREQAGLLGQATNNVLQGEVSMERGSLFESEFKVTLSIVAPALDHYRFDILRVMHDLTLYPLTVNNLVEESRYECGDEEVFLRALKEILSSPGTHRAIQSLLSQSQAA